MPALAAAGNAITEAVLKVDGSHSKVGQPD
jgi:hypothetical protein